MKNWIKPELVVLVRHHPEEMVLVACKTIYVGFGAGLYHG